FHVTGVQTCALPIMTTFGEPVVVAQPGTALRSAPDIPSDAPLAAFLDGHCSGKMSSFGEPANGVACAGDGQYGAAGSELARFVGPPAFRRTGRGARSPARPNRGGKTRTSCG